MSAIPQTIENRAKPAENPPFWRRKISSFLLTFAWTFGLAAGIGCLWEYSHTPGDAEASPESWPLTSQIHFSDDKPHLLFFAHSRCPCTRASLRELEKLKQKVQQHVQTTIVLWDPEDSSQKVSWADLHDVAEDIAETTVFHDRNRIESDRFHAKTSGLTLLYSADGKLLFQGGITASRGHEGSNDGVNALESIILGKDSPIRRTQVFGCALQCSNRQTEREHNHE